MAGRSMKHAGYRLFSPATESPAAAAAAEDEFDESDVWGFGPEPRSSEQWKPIPPASRSGRKRAEHRDRERGAAAGSLPVSIPDWSKIMRGEYGAAAAGDDGGDDSVGGFGAVIPPHELLWRSRAASFSVHEGAGRTLKGRDLSRVRNAIFEKTGFQD